MIAPNVPTVDASPTWPRLEPDFRAVFEAAPGVSLLLAPDPPRFTMLAASEERLAATLTTREAIVGRPFFEVFSDANPANSAPLGVASMRASLERAARNIAKAHEAFLAGISDHSRRDGASERDANDPRADGGDANDHERRIANPALEWSTQWIGLGIARTIR